MEVRRENAPTAAGHSDTAYVAIELSGTSWVVAVELPRVANARVHKLGGGDVAGLMRLIDRARSRGAARVVCCYEAGRDGFWLHRYVTARGVACVVLDPASLPVDRRARRAKSDRLDAHALLRAVMALEGGDGRACRAVTVPSPAVEDARQVHREREALVRERVRLVNRIKALLATQGVSGFAPLEHDRAALAGLRCGDGAALPAALRDRLGRELDRLALVLKQIAEVEAIRDAVVEAPSPADPQAAKIAQLVKLKAIGCQTATVMTREVYWRAFANRRQVGSYLGVTSTPWRSGAMAREQGISKAGNPRARAVAIELAWMWLRWQPQSALSRWFRERVGTARGRVRRIAIVAMARKLVIALWRYLNTGVVPDGALLKA
jgi:transposase